MRFGPNLGFVLAEIECSWHVFVRKTLILRLLWIRRSTARKMSVLSRRISGTVHSNVVCGLDELLVAKQREKSPNGLGPGISNSI